MADCVDYARLTRVLRTAADKLKANRDYLSMLDSATGDGDHGMAISKVADAILVMIAKNGDCGIAKLLKDIGWAVMAADAGTTSSLYGSFFIGMSETTGDVEELAASGFVAMTEQGLASLRRNTKADVGGKTMMDALVPAVVAMRRAVDSGQSLTQALSEAAAAAVKGAEATRNMKALFGRARNIGERSMGHLDPGATSMALLWVGIKEGYEDG